jgi:hypothetical protein
MWAYQKITNSRCPQINELLLVFIMNYTMMVLLCPFLLVVNINDAINKKGASPVNSTDGTKKCSVFPWTKHQQKLSHAAKAAGMRPCTHKCKSYATVHAVPSKWSHVKHLTLPHLSCADTCVSYQHGLGHAPPQQVSGCLPLPNPQKPV